MKRAIAFLSLAFASPALAAPVAIGFAPPTGQDLLYRIEQHRPVDGRDSLFSAERTLRFEKAGMAISCLSRCAVWTATRPALAPMPIAPPCHR
ncbi:hypothetical protein ACFSUK_14325 [Sphingobium scionense]